MIVDLLQGCVLENGALGKIRTPDPQIRSLVANSFILLIRMKLSAYMQLKQQFN